MEDLDILDNGTCIESIQVKSSPAFSLSDLSPRKPSSYLRRVLRHQNAPDVPEIRLVNFGTFGPEMRQAWDGKPQPLVLVVNKLEDYGFTVSEIGFVLEHVQIEELDEIAIRARVFQQLQRQLTGVDPEAAFDLLTRWLYGLAEDRASITRSHLIDEVTSVGCFLAERLAHHEEWFTSIVPLADEPISQEQRSLLEKEFREGVDANFKHILADLDFRRDEKLEQIAEAFRGNRIVIVHGPSGQGKSALGFRYMHDYYPRIWRFHIQLVENRQHALRIARAVAGHARAIQVPMAIYIDVPPRDTDWPELVRQLAMLDQFRILVTIREEDLKRANISRAWFEYKDIELSLEESEARLLFGRAKSAGQIAEFLTFEDAWAHFGASGPLMEFVYLLTHTTTLRERLQEQVSRIRDRIRTGTSHEELRLLRLVAVASAFGARIDLALLRQALMLPDLERVLQLYEREYLVRMTPDRRHVSGVHPVRSSILVDLLTHPYTEPWSEALDDVLPLIIEQDLESFVFHALVERPAERTHIVESITRIEPKTWSGMAGIARALLWLGVRGYVDSIGHILDEARQEFGPAFGFVIDFDLMELLDPDSSNWWETLGELIPSEKKQRICALRARQPPKAEAFEPISTWLKLRGRRPVAPCSSQEWSGVAFLLFWAGRLDLDPGLDGWLNDEDLAAAFGSLTLPELADLSAALYICNRARHELWFQSGEDAIEARLAREYAVVLLESVDDGTLMLHFIPSLVMAQSQEDVSETSYHDQLHDETIERIELARRLFPCYRHYSSHGYGYRFASLPSPSDDYTEKKGTPAFRLPLDWEVQPNAWLQGLCKLTYRPATWAEFARAILSLRRQICSCFDMILRGVSRFQRRDKPVNILSPRANVTVWENCLRQVREPPLLPQCAVDRWGFIHEGQSKETTSRLDEKWALRHLPFYLRNFKPYLDSSRRYMNAISAFLWQAQHVALANSVIGKMSLDDARRDALTAELHQRGIRTDLAHLSTYNLNEALDALEVYQSEFHHLFDLYLDSDELDELECVLNWPPRLGHLA